MEHLAHLADPCSLLSSPALRIGRRGVLAVLTAPACHATLRQTMGHVALPPEQLEVWQAYALARSVGPGQTPQALLPQVPQVLLPQVPECDSGMAAGTSS